MATFTRHTPWGYADRYENLGQGIFSVSTPSHGGLFVPEGMLHCIPDVQRADAAKWSGSEQWYEEDYCAYYVVEAFPDRFDARVVETAKMVNASRANYIKQNLARRTGGE